MGSVKNISQTRFQNGIIINPIQAPLANFTVTFCNFLSKTEMEFVKTY
jgi:hypothetical protein